MKKLFTLIMLGIVMIAFTDNAKAQTPSIDLIYGGDSTFNQGCSVPDTVFMFYYGVGAGYAFTDSVYIEINFGDGTDTSYYMPLIQGATFYDNIEHIYTSPGVYNVQYIATGPDGSSDTLVDNSVLIAASCGDISGSIYVDGNSNCINNAGETPIQWFVSASYNGDVISSTYSDSLGNYYMNVPDGFTYQVELYPNSWNVNCPSTSQYTVTSLPATNLDFGIECNSDFDLTGSISGIGFRAATTTTIGINAMNKLISCVPPTATVTLTLDPLLTYVSSTEVPVSSAGNVIVFNAGQLTGTVASEWMSSITVLTDTSASIGDSLCLTLTIDPAVGDFDPSDNSIYICLPVRNSFDPNEKYEVNTGSSSGVVAPNTELTYTIMFQNLGNDDAYNINVIDEIDQNLDLNTFRMVASSHDYNLYMTGNELKFEFLNINLPAASVNEPASHGYITYKISPVAGLPNGTIVNNHADIYFDFNEAIVTNTVSTEFNVSVGIGENQNMETFTVYPNPSNGYFRVITGSSGKSVLSIYDVNGKNMIAPVEVSDNQKISTEHLSTGIYVITLNTEGKIRTARLSVK